MTRRLTFLLGALSALCVALALPPDLLLPGARADVTCSTVAMTCASGTSLTPLTSDGTNITLASGQFLAPAADNCASVPYSATGSTGTGMCWPAVNQVKLQLAPDVSVTALANAYVQLTPQVLVGSLYQTWLGTNKVTQISGSYFGWNSDASNATNGTDDLKLYRDAANALALRNSTNAQKFSWYYSYTDGSNYHRGALKTSSSGIEIAAETAGSGADNLDVTLTPAGTGNVVITSGRLASDGSWLVLQSNMHPAANDTQWLGYPTTQFAHLFLAESAQGSKTKALTETTATAVTQIAVPQTAGSNFADATVQWTVYATDGTDTQTRRGSTYLAAVNKAGTETCTVGDIGTPVVAVSAGTLTCTTSCITGLTDVVQFALDCTSSLTQSTLNALVRLDMDQPNTVTPQ